LNAQLVKAPPMSAKTIISSDAVLDAVNGGLIVLDRGRRVARWNLWMATTSGIAATAALDQTLGEIFPGVDLGRLMAAVGAALTSNASTLITHALNPRLLPLRTRAQQELLHDVSVTPVGERETTGCLIFVTDVSMAVRRERYLRDQQNARYDAVVASAPDVIITVDENGVIQSANPATYAKFDYSTTDLVGKDSEILFDTRRDWAAFWRGAIAGEVEDRPKELLAAPAQGSQRHFEASASRWSIGTRKFATVILRDVTDRRAVDAALRESEGEARTAAAALIELNQTLEMRIQTRTAQLMKAEEALRHSQKMEAIGNLTGGIAHDFNNLLHVINGNLYLLKHDVAGKPAAERRVQVALDGVARSAKLSSQLLAFARRQPLAPKVINLGRFIRDMEEILRKAVGEGVTVETVIGAGLWNTLIDPGNVENALLNLAINARDAMDGHGRLTIEAGNAFLDSEYAAAHEEVARGQYVLIAVTDTGSGMPADVIEHAFEPFYTTKPVGKGTGLGLSMVYGFVKQSGGHVKIYSELGQGTTIKLYLPRSAQSEDRVVDTEAVPVKGGSEVVLVAEDDEAVRDTVVAMLSDLGYRVLKAKDAHSALSIIESGIPIDLLFTDVIMPGPLKSTELARKARERMPDLVVLFTSGYTENAIVHSGRLDESVELLSKPYSRDALARKIRSLLSSAEQRKTAREREHFADGSHLAANPGKVWRILVCENDSDIRDTTVDMLCSMGHEAMSAKDGGTALSIMSSKAIDILLTDVDLHDMSGATLAEYATSRFPALTVIFATARSHALNVPPNIRARTLIKPFSFENLVAVIDSVAERQAN
jgi:PAS domain S-box-containing protein